ncbi:hypothetical protein LTR15_002730 [Elasticomyces elasticus]|nr:hypothetical protein LTR15_002730 [Elasticomyces elasticus]
MQHKALLAYALLNAVATAAPAPQASSDTPDVQLSITELKQDILTVINDISQKRDASSDYGNAGRNLHYLVQYLNPHCTSSISLSAASTNVEAIQYLEQTQLTLSIVAQGIINSDFASAAKDVCAAADYYSAAASFGSMSSGADPYKPSEGAALASAMGSSDATISALPTSASYPTNPIGSTMTSVISGSSKTTSIDHSSSNTASTSASAPSPMTSTKSGATSDVPTTTSKPSSAATDCSFQQATCLAGGGDEKSCAATAHTCESACQSTWTSCLSGATVSSNQSACNLTYYTCLGAALAPSS